ncbi:aminotransferase class I/II-fold pyridoxal phosphate-dependent enzyme [Micromonospora sp. C95]|uniref:aminotransferase class I/II-fold pyridoxal phosphate-dependent enzyme n=1 Tax=Micromonospora sp. C95 TaxID=2824882 RepID=UPI001B3831CB|nr:aminotransferase class I/II-fold pyridoxal phosphate-dependent enzyme [Micromonospora sp. C95]MBQ1026077.1 hypothetical protein [Micromonospora sp. C95]
MIPALGTGPDLLPPVTGSYPPLAEPDGTGSPALPDVECVTYYRRIRSRTTAAARQLGYGINRRMPATGVRQWLSRMYDDMFDGRIADYTGSGDLADRHLIAELAGRYLGTRLRPEHVVLFNGSTEAISVLLGFAAAQGMPVAVPLPLYCSFEQSAARHRVRVCAYYTADGRMLRVSDEQGPGPLFVDVAPNGVTGAWARTEPVRQALMPSFDLVDHVFALPTFQPAEKFLGRLRARVTSLDRTAVLMSPSKDLSVPGLRCGVMLTRNPELLAYSRADRFERGYSVAVGLGRVAAVHLALLLAVFDPTGAGRATVLADDFRAAGLPWCGESTLAGFRTVMESRRGEFLQALSMADHSGLLMPVDRLPDPVAGFSAFRRIPDLPTGEALTAWATEAGRVGLKVNPMYLFGADEQVWNRLYPGTQAIRLNISVPPDALRNDLDALRAVMTVPALMKGDAN